ncbi:MAG: Gfo/Idh/MocA family protein [Planctomycetota bacterium]
MSSLNRRQFIKRSRDLGIGTAAFTILSEAGSARATPANDKVILAAVGCGGRGTHLMRGFLERGDCEYAYACDPKKTGGARSAEGLAAEIEKRQGGRPKAVADFRDALQDKSVDAIISATPDHWHGLSTVWACQAGKDVYVEKPPTHNCWEGQQMVKAAREHDRVVQCGFQNRSAPYNMAAKKYLDEGKLGTIHLCRIYNQKRPWGMQRKVPNSEPPAGFNWNIWNGPAPEHPYNAGMHRCWHHQWRYSGGDIANDASHQIDLARWLLGLEVPKTVYCSGGRYAADPEELVAETPDTQIALYDYDKLLVSFELTLFGQYMLKTDSVVRDSDMFPYWMQNSTRIEIFGTEGMMVVGRHGGGWQVFVRPKSRKRVVKDEQYGRFPDPDHKENFVEAIRNRQRPSADVLEGHLSCLMIHYANISYRIGGQKLAIDPDTQHIVDNDEAMELFRRSYRPPWVIEEQA